MKDIIDRHFKKNHILTFDFESWIFSEKINKKKLSNKKLKELDDGYTLSSLEYILYRLKKNKQKITIFLVLKLEELYPGIIERILKDGHEIGWHGYSHAILENEQILISELEKSKKLLSKYKIIGFQAPMIIFFRNGYSILKRYGFKYSSSIYGNSNNKYNFDGVIEIPVSTNKRNYALNAEDITFPSNISVSNILKFGIPIGSSYFWSILGGKYYEKKLLASESQNNRMNLFIHNWQIYDVTSYHKIYLPDDKMSFFTNPLFYPYTINVGDIFETLISKFKFSKLIEVI